MRYQSNLHAPDLRPYFKLLDPPMQHAGHDEPSDPDFLPNCGFWTDDEAAILYNVAKAVPAGAWVDIGARLGWTSAHVAAAGHVVIPVDPELAVPVFEERFHENTRSFLISIGHSGPSTEFFNWSTRLFDGFVIDGCHDAPEPLNDARGALAHAKPDCIIMFHDCLTGLAVRDGVRFLMDHGWRCKFYWTPNGVACCWRGFRTGIGGGPATDYFIPPVHVSDPAIDFRPHKAGMVDMVDYWARCE